MTPNKTLLVFKEMFYHLNQNTDVSVTFVEVVIDDRGNQIKKI